MPPDASSIGEATPNPGNPGQPTLVVMFAPNQRPHRDGLGQATLAAGPDRIEVVGAGVRFDVSGLAPGPAAPAPRVDHRYGFAEAPDLAGLEALGLRPAVPVGRGDGLRAVVRALVSLGGALAALPGVAAVCWPSAGTLMAPAYFCRLTGAWLQGGAFPGLGLTALAVGPAGARSTGLGLFTGYEIETSGGESAADDARLALRAIHLLAESGASGYDALGRITDGELRWEFAAERRLLSIRQVPRGAG